MKILIVLGLIAAVVFVVIVVLYNVMTSSLEDLKAAKARERTYGRRRHELRRCTRKTSRHATSHVQRTIMHAARRGRR